MNLMTDRDKITGLTNKLKKINLPETINIMEVCGTHTHAIGRSGIRQLLPENIRLVSGPGCPVCVTHDGDIDGYLNLALNENVIITTFGDLMKVPGSMGSLADVRGKGAKVEVVYSPLDSLRIALDNPNKEVVFLGVGFETTAPAVAVTVMSAHKQQINNFSVLSMHKLVPPALAALLGDDEIKVDGFILPGHVSTILGLEPFKFLSSDYEKSGVIAGFEPSDIMEAIIMLSDQIRRGQPDINIQYSRGVSQGGNALAREAMFEVFEPEDAWWRGLGELSGSGLGFKEKYGFYNAKTKFDLGNPQSSYLEKNSACSCGEILKGLKIPNQCELFGLVCTPISPKGPCMVSSEGTCAAYFKYAQYREM